MFVLGIVILGILFIHLNHFWAKMQLLEFMGQEAENPYLLLNATFHSWISLTLYLVWFAAVFLHLIHGFWSMFQTVGWNNQIWMKRLKVIGFIVALIIVLGFVSVAVNAFLHSNAII